MKYQGFKISENNIKNIHLGGEDPGGFTTKMEIHN